MSLATVLIIAGAALALVLVGLGLVFFKSPALQGRIESLFRRPPKPHKTAGDEQYYRPYWSR